MDPPSRRRDGPGGVAPYHAWSSDTGYVVLHRQVLVQFRQPFDMQTDAKAEVRRRLFSNPVAELPIEEPLELGNRNRTRAIGQVRLSIGNWLTTSNRTERLRPLRSHLSSVSAASCAPVPPAFYRALSPPPHGFLVSSDALEAILLSVKYPFARSCSSLGSRSVPMYSSRKSSRTWTLGVRRDGPENSAHR